MIVVNNPHRAKSDIEIGQRHREEGKPGPVAVVFVQARGTIVDLLVDRVHGQFVVQSANKVPEGMAAEGIAGEEDDVQAHDDGADADAEGLGAIGKGPDKTKDGIIVQNEVKQNTT